MEAYETYNVDDVYIVCEIGSDLQKTKALLTLSEFHTVCVGKNPAEECQCEGKQVYREKASQIEDDESFGANIYQMLIFVSIAVSLIAITLIVVICIC